MCLIQVQLFNVCLLPETSLESCSSYSYCLPEDLLTTFQCTVRTKVYYSWVDHTPLHSKQPQGKFDIQTYH